MGDPTSNTHIIIVGAENIATEKYQSVLITFRKDNGI
jgi:hypothetical protein